MSTKSQILSSLKNNIKERFPMPDIQIDATTYADPLAQFVSMTQSVGGKVEELQAGDDINQLIRSLYPDAKEIASSLPEITIATRNPDTTPTAQSLNGTDVGIVRGEFGVWIPQTMKERAVCFISENLVILLPKASIVNNMHEAYRRISFNDLGYGTFISGPSKTADIAQVLVMGAQAARTLTVILIP